MQCQISSVDDSNPSICIMFIVQNEQYSELLIQADRRLEPPHKYLITKNVLLFSLPGRNQQENILRLANYYVVKSKLLTDFLRV